jgi:hypothetical protein
MCFNIITCGPNEAMIISGMFHSTPTYINGGRAIVFPCVQKVQVCQCDKHRVDIMINCFLIYIFGQCLNFSFSTHKQCILSQFIHSSIAMFPLKTIYPWWDLNPGLLVPEADVMSTAPRPQGIMIKFLQKHNRG